MNHRKEQTNSSAGLLIGLIISFLIGLAIIKSGNRAYKYSFYPYGIAIGVVITAVVGYKIGEQIDIQQYRDECLGINDITTNILSQDGNWRIESNWAEFNSLSHSLVTTFLQQELVTIFDGVLVINHGYGNVKSATQLHEEVKQEIIEKLKAAFSAKIR